MASLLGSIPDTVWGAIAGALIALCGVALSNRSAMTRLARELEHSADQGRSEREAQLRKEIFLNAVDTLSAFSQHLGLFANWQQDPAQASPVVQTRAGALAKVQLIATGETLHAVQRATSAYGRAAFELALGRTRLITLQSQLATANNLITSGQVPREQLPALYVAQGRLQAQMFSGIINHLELTIRRVIEFAEAVVPVMLRFREELGTPIDAKSFEDSYRESQRVLRELTDKFIADLRAGAVPLPGGAPPAA